MNFLLIVSRIVNAPFKKEQFHLFIFLLSYFFFISVRGVFCTQLKANERERKEDCCPRVFLVDIFAFIFSFLSLSLTSFTSSSSFFFFDVVPWLFFIDVFCVCVFFFLLLFPLLLELDIRKSSFVFLHTLISLSPCCLPFFFLFFLLSLSFTCVRGLCARSFLRRVFFPSPPFDANIMSATRPIDSRRLHVLHS